MSLSNLEKLRRSSTMVVDKDTMVVRREGVILRRKVMLRRKAILRMKAILRTESILRTEAILKWRVIVMMMTVICTKTNRTERKVRIMLQTKKIWSLLCAIQSPMVLTTTILHRSHSTT